MIIRQIWENGQKSSDGEKILIRENETETIALGYMSVPSGESTKEGFHDDEEEIYVILKGEAILEIGEESQKVGPGFVAYVPKNTRHRMTCVSDANLEYLYFANWPGRATKSSI